MGNKWRDTDPTSAWELVPGTELKKAWQPQKTAVPAAAAAFEIEALAQIKREKEPAERLKDEQRVKLTSVTPALPGQCDHAIPVWRFSATQIPGQLATARERLSGSQAAAPAWQS